MRANQSFIFLYTTSEEKEYYEALFLSYRPPYKMQYFTIFQDKLHSFNIQDHRSTRGLSISETVQKISKITYAASRFSLLTNAKFSVNIKRVKFQHNKNFFLMAFVTMCNLKKRLIRAAFWVLLQNVYERLKTNDKAIKIARDY